MKYHLLTDDIFLKYAQSEPHRKALELLAYVNEVLPYMSKTYDLWKSAKLSFPELEMMWKAASRIPELNKQELDSLIEPDHIAELAEQINKAAQAEKMANIQAKSSASQPAATLDFKKIFQASTLVPGNLQKNTNSKQPSSSLLSKNSVPPGQTAAGQIRAAQPSPPVSSTQNTNSIQFLDLFAKHASAQLFKNLLFNIKTAQQSQPPSIPQPKTSVATSSQHQPFYSPDSSFPVKDKTIFRVIPKVHPGDVSRMLNDFIYKLNQNKSQQPLNNQQNMIQKPNPNKVPLPEYNKTFETRWASSAPTTSSSSFSQNNTNTPEHAMTASSLKNDPEFKQRVQSLLNGLSG